jgi:(S)-2-hydroxyglutarate dehydrogenase
MEKLCELVVTQTFLFNPHPTEIYLIIYDYFIIGGGFCLDTAYKLLEIHPGANLILIGKEPELRCHQTRHNRGIINAGIYYVLGSLKAKFCRRT